MTDKKKKTLKLTAAALTAAALLLISIPIAASGSGSSGDAGTPESDVPAPDIPSSETPLIFFENDTINYTFGCNNGIVSSQSALKTCSDDPGKISYSIPDRFAGYLRIDEAGVLRIIDYVKAAAAVISSENSELLVTVTAHKTAGTVVVTPEIPAPPADEPVPDMPPDCEGDVSEDITSDSGIASDSDVNGGSAENDVNENNSDSTDSCSSNNTDETDANIPDDDSDVTDINTPGDNTSIADSSTPNDSSDVADSNTPNDSSDVADSNTPNDSSDVADSSTPNDSSDVADSNTPNDSSDVADSSTPNDSSDVADSSTPNDSSDVADSNTSDNGFNDVNNSMPGNTADNTNNTLAEDTSEQETVIYEAASANCTVSIRFADMPDDIYKVDGPLSASGWYGSAVTVSAVDALGYSLSKVCDPAIFSESISFNEEGLVDRCFFIKDTSTGAISYKILSDIKIDTTAPAIAAEFSGTDPVNILPDSSGNPRRYYNCSQTLTVTVKDRHFSADRVSLNISAVDASGSSLNSSSLYTTSCWHADDSGINHSISLTFYGDANYTFNAAYTGISSNTAVTAESLYFTVDTTAPTDLSISYNTSLLDTVLGALSFGFYKSNVSVTITARDDISGINSFTYSFLTAASLSSENINSPETIDSGHITFSDGMASGTASFTIPQLNGSFSGTVAFTAYDRCGNMTEFNDDKRIVIDSISPTASVIYNSPVNTEKGISYYDGDVNVSITISESNFYPEDIKVSVSKDGAGAYTVKPSWSNTSSNIHDGAFTLTDDGSYSITIMYRDKSTNEMEVYVSNPIVIDTKTDYPVFLINGKTIETTNEKVIAHNTEDNINNAADHKYINSGGSLINSNVNNAEKSTLGGGTYSGDIRVTFSFADANFDSHSVTLKRTSLGLYEDITEEYIDISLSNTGGSGSFEIPVEPRNDGIYELTVNFSDKALHSAGKTLKFTVSRFGSVYEYSSYLMSLINSRYIKKHNGANAAIAEDIVITEYSAAPLLEGSGNILITRDGEVIDADYHVLQTSGTAPVQNAVQPSDQNTDQNISKTLEPGAEQTASQTSGQNTDLNTVQAWHSYIYIIDKENFAEDGLYRITLSSEYSSSDSKTNTSVSVPENSVGTGGESISDSISFIVDTAPPEIRSISNLDQAYADASSLNVHYSVFDVGGLDSIEVFVDDSVVSSVDFSENVVPYSTGNADLSRSENDTFSYSGSFTLSQSPIEQTVRLKVKDRAGNITDTATDDFNTNGLYIFNDKITVFPKTGEPQKADIAIPIALCAAVAAVFVYMIIRCKKRS